MNLGRSTCLAATLAALLSVPVLAATSDVWLRTKAETVLLTTDGVGIAGVHVVAVNGIVTLRGKVKTDAEKEKATLVLRSVDGVKTVRNLLQVVPDAFKSTLKASDEAIKDGVETTFKSDKGVEGVTVVSVNNGVVLLSGKASTPVEKLRAIELAWNVGGVSRVTSEIETGK